MPIETQPGEGATNASEQDPSQSVQPVFDGGAFTIEMLSTEPGGFEIKTKQNLRLRQEFYRPNDRLPISDSQKAKLTDGMRFEVRNALTKALGGPFDTAQEPEIDSAETASLELFGLTPEQITEHKNKLDQARQKLARFQKIHTQGLSALEHTKYMDALRESKKTAIRHVERDGNTILIDVLGTYFPFYRHISTPQDGEALRISNISAVCGVVETSDGLIPVQFRDPVRNRSYGGVPGTGLGGLFDVPARNKKEPGSAPDITDRHIKRHGLKEGREEIALGARISSITTDDVTSFAARKFEVEIGDPEKDIDSIAIIGLATDKVKIHDEFLMSLRIKKTGTELLETAALAPRKKDRDNYDFEEEFFFIDATPESIEVLTCEVECPLPPTHAANYIAKGYELILRRHVEDPNCKEIADQWLLSMQERTKEYWERINRRVSIFHQENPHVREKNPAMNPNGYDPNFTPEVQGLPSLESELIRTGLEVKVERNTPVVFVLDVDGVVTDPEEQKVTEDALFELLQKALSMRLPIVLNSGRPLKWINEEVAEPLIARLKESGADTSILSNLLIVGEMGGTFQEYDAEGNPDVHVDENLQLPPELSNILLNTIRRKYPESMIFDEDKLTMMSYVKPKGFDQGEFDVLKTQAMDDIQQIITASGYDQEFKVGTTTIAVDVQSRAAGKSLGAGVALEWLRRKRIKPEQFIAFGDSDSDIDMSDRFYSEGKNVEFHYVGEKLGDKIPREYQVIEDRRRFSQVTADVLNRLLSD